jgi:hypothetical protein
MEEFASQLNHEVSTQGSGLAATGEVWNTQYILPKGGNPLVCQEILIAALLRRFQHVLLRIE